MKTVAYAVKIVKWIMSNKEKITSEFKIVHFGEWQNILFYTQE